MTEKEFRERVIDGNELCHALWDLGILPNEVDVFRGSEVNADVFNDLKDELNNRPYDWEDIVDEVCYCKEIISYYADDEWYYKNTVFDYVKFDDDIEDHLDIIIRYLDICDVFTEE